MKYKCIKQNISNFTKGKVYSLVFNKPLTFGRGTHETDKLGLLVDDRGNIRRNPLYYGDNEFEPVYDFQDYLNEVNKL